MNILLINHYAGSPELGMEFRPYYMAKEWVKAGHNVLIVGASFSHLRKKQPESEESVIDGVRYRWIKVNPYQGNGLGRIRSMFTFVSKLNTGYKKLLGDFRPDVVIASSTYPLDIYPCRRIAKHYGAKLVYEVHDLWPLSPMELGGYSKHHPFIMVMQAAEDYCYKHSDKVVSLLPNALEHMVERGMDPGKFVYIPNGYVAEEWEKPAPAPEAVVSTIKNIKENGKFVVMYAGGHAISNALDFFLDAMKMLRESNIVAVMIGSGQEKSRLEKRLNEEQIKNVIMHEPVKKEEIPATLALSDALYIGWKKNPLYRFGICPNKLFDYMMASKPIIHSVAAPNDWVKDAKCGISVEAENAQELAQALREMSKWPSDKLAEMGQRGKAYCQKMFKYSDLADKFLKAL